MLENGAALELLPKQGSRVPRAGGLEQEMGQGGSLQQRQGSEQGCHNKEQMAGA